MRAGGKNDIPVFALYGNPMDSSLSRFVHTESIEDSPAAIKWEIQAHRHVELYQLVVLTQGHGHIQLDKDGFKFNSPWIVAGGEFKAPIETGMFSQDAS
jgi:AraC family transcriptional activator of pobA